MDLRGLGIALVTPFDKDGEIDKTGLIKVLDHISGDANYIVAFGTTGESVTLTKYEKKNTLEFLKQESKLPIVLGHGGNNTQQLIDDLSEIDWKDIEAILSVSPYYNKPSQSGIIKHYESLADACPVPVILYNVPGRTGSNITAQTTIHLAKHPNIIGTKEASGDLIQASQVAQNTADDFILISGDDLLTVDLIKAGATGLISVLANAYPRIFKEVFTRMGKGNIDDARLELSKLEALNVLMYKEGSPTGIKELLSQLHLCSPDVRLPMDRASQELSFEIREILLSQPNLQ